MKYVRELASAIIIFIILSGCTSWTNPSPDPVHATVISFDEFGNQTGGIIKVDVELRKFIVTESLVKKYNALIRLYGNDHVPKIKENDGITKIDGVENLYYLDPMYLAILDEFIRKHNGALE